MLQKITLWLQQLQRYLAPRQKTVIRCFLVAEIGVLVFGALIAYLAISNPLQNSWLLSESGEKLGQIAVALFCLTLLPGIMKRLSWNTPLTVPIISLLTLFRRHIGITMFLTAGVHMIFNFVVPNYIFFGTLLPPRGLPTYELVGLISWFLLLPVWLTSNDASQRFLGRKWKMLQRLTYISIWFIFIHVALQGKNLAIIVAITALLEALSWIVSQRKKALAPISPSATL